MLELVDRWFLSNHDVTLYGFKSHYLYLLLSPFSFIHPPINLFSFSPPPFSYFPSHWEQSKKGGKEEKEVKTKKTRLISEPLNSGMA